MAEYGKNKGYQKKGTALYYGSSGSLSLGTGSELPIFSTEQFNDSQSISKISSTQIQLKAGKKYYISTEFVFVNNTVGGNFNFQWYNNTGGTSFGTFGSVTATNYSLNTAGGSASASAFIIPTVDTTISCRIGSITGTVTSLIYVNSYIEEVEAYLSETLGRTRFTENVTFDGFTKLGSGSTGVKMKVLTGTTAAAQGSTASIPHGLDSTKITSINAVVFATTNEPVAPEYTAYSTYQFSLAADGTNVFVKNSATNSVNILSKTVKIMVWYEE